jgi:hypothetical protein
LEIRFEQARTAEEQIRDPRKSEAGCNPEHRRTPGFSGEKMKRTPREQMALKSIR